jgi:hypothetical protein
MIDDTDKYLRDNLDNIMKGEWDEHFNEEQLEQARKMSFLLNHITQNERTIVFEYNNLKINCVLEDPMDFQIYGIDQKSHVISQIKNTDIFLDSYKSFLRDWKIGKILE